jgi:four helix bundle protein
MNRQELEERLIDFAVSGIETGKSLPKDEIGRYLAGQLMRSSSSPALNYGEAQSAESRKDFAHKISIILKELRESMICMKIIKRSNLVRDLTSLEIRLNECNELISIFVKTLKSTQKSNLII